MRNITRRVAKDGSVSYLIRVSDGYASDGSQIKKSMTWKPAPGMSEKAIEKELEHQRAAFEDKIKNGFSIDANIRFQDYAARWLEVNKPNHAPITHVRYETLLVRVNQSIGHIRMVKLTPMHLHNFYKNLSEITSEKTGRPLSQRTINHYHKCIGAILAQATRERVMPRNIASREFMDAPKLTKKELAHLTDAEAQHFVDLLLIEEDIRIKAVLLLMLYSGCRIGEITGLEWSDCNFDKQTIQVKRSSQYVKGRGIITKEPKNQTSKRTIKLPQIIITILTAYKSWYDEQREMYGDRWQESNRLFIQSDGKPIQPGTINKWLDNFIKKHGFPHVTPHSLRHTNISLLIASGVDLRTVSAKAGHSRTSTTMDIYAYEIQAANEQSTDVLDTILTPKNRRAVSD